MNARLARSLRLVAGLAILGLLVRTVGAGPFLAGVRHVDLPVLLVGTVLGAGATMCGAWRWRLVARALGLELPLRDAVTASYRSQLLNVTLPGGIVGDVHRALDHGRRTGRTAPAVRAVGWERSAGQMVQLGLTAAVLVLLPSPLGPRPWRLLVVIGVLVLLVAVVASAKSMPGLRVLRSDLVTGLLTRRTWPGVLVVSALAVVAHVATFLVAARAAGVVAPVTQLLPLALLVLVAMAVPASIAGWGPREGAAAWAFGAAGLGASQGVSVAVVYGVVALTASLPGLLVLLLGTRASGRPPLPTPTPEVRHA
jgi:uncharacterized membrane protein YbhN (UPF0104 family)